LLASADDAVVGCGRWLGAGLGAASALTPRRLRPRIVLDLGAVQQAWPLVQRRVASLCPRTRLLRARSDSSGPPVHRRRFFRGSPRRGTFRMHHQRPSFYPPCKPRSNSRFFGQPCVERGFGRLPLSTDGGGGRRSSSFLGRGRHRWWWANRCQGGRGNVDLGLSSVGAGGGGGGSPLPRSRAPDRH